MDVALTRRVIQRFLVVFTWEDRGAAPWVAGREPPGENLRLGEMRCKRGDLERGLRVEFQEMLWVTLEEQTKEVCEAETHHHFRAVLGEGCARVSAQEGLHIRDRAR